MASYILRLRDDEHALWARVKARSEAEGIPLRAIILQLLEAYGAGRVRVTIAHAARRQTRRPVERAEPYD